MSNTTLGFSMAPASVFCQNVNQGMQPQQQLPLGAHPLALLDTLSPKTSGALNRNKEEKIKVNIDSGEYLREYNWGVTTNYSSIYTIVHEVSTRLACDVQPSISQLY